LWTPLVHRVAIVRTDVSEDISAYIRSVPRLLLTANVISPILFTLMIKAPSSSEPSVLTRATRRIIEEDGVLLGITLV
jgi:hypothetical protein